MRALLLILIVTYIYAFDQEQLIDAIAAEWNAIEEDGSMVTGLDNGGVLVLFKCNEEYTEENNLTTKFIIAPLTQQAQIVLIVDINTPLNIKNHIHNGTITYAGEELKQINGATGKIKYIMLHTKNQDPVQMKAVLQIAEHALK